MHPIGMIETRSGGRHTVRQIALITIAGHGGDDAAGGIHFAHPVVAFVGNIDIAGGVQMDAARFIELGTAGRSAVAQAVDRIAAAGHCADNTGSGIDPTDTVVFRIRDKNIAGVIHPGIMGIS